MLSRFNPSPQPEMTPGLEPSSCAGPTASDIRLPALNPQSPSPSPYELNIVALKNYLYILFVFFFLGGGFLTVHSYNIPQKPESNL